MSTRVQTDEKDRAILKMLQDDLPVTERPYAEIADALAITQEDVLTRILRMKEEGLIRRVGAILRHNRAGYAHNALTAWTITPGSEETYEAARDRVGEVLAKDDHISHCYARKVTEAFPYPMFAMVHASSGEELTETISALRLLLPDERVRVLRSTREWKKTSMRYV